MNMRTERDADEQAQKALAHACALALNTIPGLAEKATANDEAYKADADQHRIHIQRADTSTIETVVFISGYGMNTEDDDAAQHLDDKPETQRVRYLHVEPGQRKGLHAKIHADLAHYLATSSDAHAWHAGVRFTHTSVWIEGLCAEARGLDPKAAAQALAEIESLRPHWEAPQRAGNRQRLHALADTIASMTHVRSVDLGGDDTDLGQSTHPPSNTDEDTLGFQMELFGHATNLRLDDGQEITWCGCIAAHANRLWGENTHATLWERARHALGLSPSGAARLFWPGTEEHGSDGLDLEQITPARAAHALRHTADGGQTPWAQRAEVAHPHTH